MSEHQFFGTPKDRAVGNLIIFEVQEVDYFRLPVVRRW